MKLYLKIEKNQQGQDYIQDIKFETLGCAAAIATSSVVTDLAKGKNLKDAMEIKNEDVVKALDDLPAVKIHCSLLAVDALTEAIYSFYQKNNQPISAEFEQKHNRIITCQTRLKH
jgi:nitrogen fixation NifU-like protein